MINRIFKYINSKFDEFYSRLFKYILKKYKLNIYFKDRLGILSKMDHKKNYEYVFRTGNSCDAIPMMEYLSDQVEDLNICLDVGAHTGIVSIWMARSSVKVYAFEPDERNRAIFKENMFINNIDNIEIIPYAVSNRSGWANFYLYKGSGHHSLGKVETSDGLGETRVKVTTLQDFCDRNKINQVDILKIDSEGFEFEVLEGAEELLKNGKVRMIIFEIARKPLQRLNRDPKDIYSFLKTYGYFIKTIGGEVVKLENMDDIVHADLVATIKD